MDKAEAIERLEYLKAKAQLALEQEIPEWVADDILGTIEAYDMAIEALQTEPTISKMEQVEDEPQTIKVGMATDSVTGKVLGVTLDTDCAWGKDE